MNIQNRQILQLEDCISQTLTTRTDSVLDHSDRLLRIKTPSSEQPTLNGVYFFRPQKFEKFEEIALKHINYFKDKRFRWVVGPLDQPEVLRPFLEEQGLIEKAHCLGLVKEIGTNPYLVPPNIRVELIDEANIEDYVDCSIKGWGDLTIDPHRFLKELKINLSKGNPPLCYIAYLDNLRAGSGVLRIVDSRFGTVGYLKGSSVVKEHRRKGVYRALLNYRLNELIKKNVSHAMTVAKSDTTAVQCMSYGFEKIFDHYIMERPAPH